MKWLGAVSLLLCGIVAIVTVYAGKMRRRNRFLTKKASNWAHCENCSFNGVIGEASDSASLQKGNGDILKPEPEDIELSRMLDEYMKEHKPYVDAGLSLDMVSDKLDVSRNRLSRALNRTSKYGFKQYLNNLRVREAILLMDDPKNDMMSLEQLMERAGFNSRSSFYEAFKKATDLTPAQYRKSRQYRTDSRKTE